MTFLEYRRCHSALFADGDDPVCSAAPNLNSPSPVKSPGDKRIGWWIVQWEQVGLARAEYGAYLLDRLSADLTESYGRGFSRRAVYQMRSFFYFTRRLSRRRVLNPRQGQGTCRHPINELCNHRLHNSFCQISRCRGLIMSGSWR